MNKKSPDIDEKELEKKAEEDPKSKKWNNPNSRKNLKQYKEEPVEPDIIDVDDEEGTDEEVAQRQADEITRGRKLDAKLIRGLMPKRTVLTPAEREAYNRVVIVFLSDFKNEEPTASDVDDLREIALCEVMEMRLLEWCKSQPGALIAASQSLERFHKRRQKARENLSNRRIDRKDARNSQDINIVDLVARYDNSRQELEKEKAAALLREADPLKQKLRELIEKENV